MINSQPTNLTRNHYIYAVQQMLNLISNVHTKKVLTFACVVGLVAIAVSAVSNVTLGCTFYITFSTMAVAY